VNIDLRQERLVFIAALGLAAVTLYGGGGAERPRRERGSGSERVELARFAAPVWPASSAGSASQGSASQGSAPRSTPQAARARGLFSPPRDTRPLDPLAFEAPPLPPLRQLAPPGYRGPAPRDFARLLGREPLRLELPDLFVDEGSAETEPAAPLVSPFAGADSFSDLDPTERLEAQEAFRAQYDWLRTEAELLFGQIVDGNRFSLALPSRAADPIRFVQIDPFSGLQRFPGQPPIAYDRSRLVEFGFAATPANDLEQRFRALPDPLTPGSYGGALELAERALALRLEVPRATQIAADIYRRAQAAKPLDPAPQIGLAQTLEAARDYAGALAAIESLCARYPASADVFVALGELQARFLDLPAAEANLRRAVSVERASFRAHQSLGRLLFRQGRFGEARESFRLALANAPAAMEARAERLDARLWLARAELADGDPAAAQENFAGALQTAPDSALAWAGLLECARLASGQPGGGAGAEPEAAGAPLGLASAAPGNEGGAELALARGLWLLDQRALPAASDPAALSGAALLGAAKAELESALRADPLATARPLAALSFLAERCGQDGPALDYATRALQADPGDPWVLYQRGRLLRLREDFSGARAHLEAALARESDFEDALAELGELSLASEDFASAERYFERALELAEQRGAARPDLLARRAFARLYEQAYRDARSLFEAALALDGQRDEARAGLAWCEYRLGAVEEGLIQLRALDDSRRALGEEDPLRRWALGQIGRIEEHRSKDVWSDRFEYTRIGNGWQVDEAAGPTAKLVQGQLVLSGNFQKSGEVRFWREYAASEFVALDADISIAANSTVRAGLFVAREVSRPSGVQVQAKAALARARDGTIQVLGQDATRGESSWQDLSRVDFPFPGGRPVHVRIERISSGREETVSILLDGVPVLSGRALSSLGRGNAPLKVGVFAEGDSGRQVELTLDDVEITRRIR
jgi:Tfp pilus assembly protein PilF